MSDTIEALVGSIQEEVAGDELVADASPGDVTLYLEDVADFDEGGGLLALEVLTAEGDPTYDVVSYLGIDDDEATVALEAPLINGYPAETVVQVRVPSLDGGTATVVEYDVELIDPDTREIVTATLAHELIPLLGVDTRGLANETVVAVRDDGEDDFEVRRVIGKQAVLDGAAIAPGTMPPPGPGPKPDASPALKVYGHPRGLTVEAATVDTGVVIDYHISMTQGFEPTTATLYASTASTVINIEAMPDGSPLSPDATYYLRAVAHNASGTAPAGIEVPASMRLVDSDAVSDIIASKIVTGDLLGAFALLGSLQIGNSTWDPDGGIQIPGVMSIPVNGVDLPWFLMRIVAEAATFKGDVSMYGLSQLFGQLRVANGTTTPTSKPTPGSSWPSMKTALGSDVAVPAKTARGLVERIDNPNYWLTARSFFGGSFYAVHKETGATDSFLFATMPDGFSPDGGLTRIGERYYVLGSDAKRDGNWYVYAFNSSFAKVDEFYFMAFGSLSHRPAIGTDGDRVLCAFSGADEKQYIREFNRDTGSLIRTNCIRDNATRTHMAGVYRGTADLGVDAFIAVTAGGAVYISNPGSWTSSSKPLARRTTNEWRSAGSGAVAGLQWDGTRFRHLDDSGNIWSYSKQTGTSTVEAAHAWYDGDSAGTGTHETQAGPRASWSWKPRTWLTVTTPPPPDAANTDPMFQDKANQVRVYVSPSAGGTLRLQATLGVGVTTTELIDALDTSSASPKLTNEFTTANAAAGQLESTAQDVDGNPLWAFRGDGATILPLKKGTSTISGTVGAGVGVGFDVSFGRTLTKVPEVFAQLAGFVSGSGSIIIRTVDQVSKTGFRVVLLNVGSNSATVSNLPIRWLAFE